YVTFADKQTQVGGDRQSARLYFFLGAIASYLFEKLLPIDSRRRRHCFQNSVHRGRDTAVFMTKGAYANWGHKQHPAPVTKNVQAVLSKSAGQLLHHV